MVVLWACKGVQENNRSILGADSLDSSPEQTKDVLVIECPTNGDEDNVHNDDDLIVTKGQKTKGNGNGKKNHPSQGEENQQTDGQSLSLSDCNEENFLDKNDAEDQTSSN